MSAKEQKVYRIKLNGEYVTVSKEVYLEWYRPIWRTLRYAYRHGQCRSPHWQFCVGDCGVCEFRRKGDLYSSDELFDAYDYEFGAAESVDPAIQALDNISLCDLLDELDRIDPIYRRMAELLESGVNDRAAAEMLGLPKSTYSDKKMKLRRELKKWYGKNNL